MRAFVVVAALAAVLALAACQQQAPGAKPADTTTPAEPPQNIVRQFTLRAPDFQVGEIAGIGIAAVTYSMPELTAAVVRSGLVHAYISVPAAPNAWTALPFNLGVRGIVLTITYGFVEGSFEVALAVDAAPAHALRAALPGLDGWVVRVVVDTP